MPKALLLAAMAAMLCGPGLGHAQPGPTPGPNNPAPTPNSPLSKPGTDLVINPTIEECQKGWTAGLKWTREQFDAFCTQMKTSK